MLCQLAKSVFVQLSLPSAFPSTPAFQPGQRDSLPRRPCLGRDTKSPRRHPTNEVTTEHRPTAAAPAAFVCPVCRDCLSTLWAGRQAGRQVCRLTYAGCRLSRQRLGNHSHNVQLDDMTHVLTVLYCGHRPDNHGHDVRLDDCGFTIPY